MDDEIDMCFTADKNEDGTYIPSTMKISFDNTELNKRLCKYLETKDLLDTAKENYPNNLNNQQRRELEDLEKTTEEIKQSLIDSNLIIRKGTSGITVKIPSILQ